MGLSGLILSLLLLALLVAVQARARRRVAIAIAMSALERTNRHLVEQERTLLWAQRTAQLGSWTYDPSTGQPSWSEGMFLIWGLDPNAGAPSYETHRRYIHPDDWPAFDQAVSRAAQRGEPYQLKLRIRRPDGEERRMITICTPHLDAHGKVVTLSGTNQDVTEREELSNRIEKIATHVPGMIFQYQQWPDGRAAFPYVSAGIRDIYGVESAEVSTDATAVFDRLHPDDRSRVKDKIAESIRSLAIWHDSYRVKLPDGREIWVEGEASPERQADGSVLWHGHIRDVTDRKRDEQKLRITASVFANSFEAIVITDPENRIIDTNPAFSTITGFEQASVLGKDPNILASGRHDAAFYSAMWDEIKQTGSWRGEIWNRRKDGEIYAEVLAISAVHNADDSVQNYIGVFSDISALKEHEAELDWLANHAPLTKLPNRRLLGGQLEQSLAATRRSGRHMAVCYLDLDDFKVTNDQYGHEVGDEVLIGFATSWRPGSVSGSSCRSASYRRRASAGARLRSTLGGFARRASGM
jgi:PAS domain S-box-containing protein